MSFSFTMDNYCLCRATHVCVHEIIFLLCLLVLLYRLAVLKGHTMAVTSVDWSVLDGVSLLYSIQLR